MLRVSVWRIRAVIDARGLYLDLISVVRGSTALIDSLQHIGGVHVSVTRVRSSIHPIGWFTMLNKLSSLPGHCCGRSLWHLPDITTSKSVFLLGSSDDQVIAVLRWPSILSLVKMFKALSGRSTLLPSMAPEFDIVKCKRII